MSIDRYTKIVLTIIAIALSVIALNPWIGPTDTYAKLPPLYTKETYIAEAVYEIYQDLRHISEGECDNNKLCQSGDDRVDTPFRPGQTKKSELPPP
jgi:hypothetical protein